MPGFNIKMPQGDAKCHDQDVPQPRRDSVANHLVETARSHRFEVGITSFGEDGIGPDVDIWWVEKCTRPTAEFDEITIHNGQDEIYRPGKTKWNPVEMTWYETIHGDDSPVDSTLRFFWFWRNEVVDHLRSKQGLPRVPVQAPRFGNDDRDRFYHRNMRIRMLDGYGNSCWRYALFDCWPLKVTPSDLDYANSELAKCTVNIRFNKCIELG